MARHSAVRSPLHREYVFRRHAALGPPKPMPKRGLSDADFLSQSRLASNDVTCAVQGFGAHDKHRFNRVIGIMQTIFRR